MRCWSGGARPAPHCRDYCEWLDEQPAERLAQKRAEADALFHRVGITFAVYGENAGHRAADPVRHRPAHHPGGRMGASWSAA